jgi:hypothetical protein
MTAHVTDAWQAALAAEHRAVFGYGLLGPHLRGSDQVLAIACSDAHEQLRDRTSTTLAASGATPVAPEADYPALYPVASAAAARALAARLEDWCAAAWRYLYLVAASSTGALANSARTAGQTALNATAVRATKWHDVIDPAKATQPFPGI